jgi:hypothetical protein
MHRGYGDAGSVFCRGLRAVNTIGRAIGVGVRICESFALGFCWVQEFFGVGQRETKGLEATATHQRRLRRTAISQERHARLRRDFRAIFRSRHSREGGNPEPSAPSFQNVIPAKAGIQRLQTFSHETPWIPAFAGMTSKSKGESEKKQGQETKQNIQSFQRHPSRTSFPRRRESRDFSVVFPERHSRERANPAASNVLARKALDSRVRGNDEQRRRQGQSKGQRQRAKPKSKVQAHSPTYLYPSPPPQYPAACPSLRDSLAPTYPPFGLTMIA